MRRILRRGGFAFASSALALATIGLAAGCGGHPAVDELEGVAAKICACPDLACVTGLEDELEAVKTKYATAKGSRADAAAIAASLAKITGCVKGLAK